MVYCNLRFFIYYDMHKREPNQPMGTPNISLISLSPFCRISHNAAVYHKWGIFISLLFIISTSFSFSRRDVLGGRGGEVLLFPVPLSLVTFPFFQYFSPSLSLFFPHSSQPAPRVRERYGFSVVPKFALTLLYIYIYIFFYVSLPFEYYSNRNLLLAKVA